MRNSPYLTPQTTEKANKFESKTHRLTDACILAKPFIINLNASTCSCLVSYKFCLHAILTLIENRDRLSDACRRIEPRAK